MELDEAIKHAKELAETLYEDVADEADELCVDKHWFFEKVVYYMRAEGEDKQ